MLHLRPARVRPVLVAVMAGVTACGGGGPDGATRITTVGTPSPNLPTFAAPDALLQPSCSADPTRAGVGVWKPISLEGAPDHADATLWTGAQLIVVNSYPDSRVPDVIRAYDPILDHWRDLTPPPGVGLNRFSLFLGFVAGKLIVYGGSDLGSPGRLTDGWTIDLATNTWAAMAPGPPLANWDSRRQRVFADESRALFLPGDYDVAAASYDLVAGAWATVPLPASTPGGGCMSPGWNGRVALCGSLDYLFTVSANPLSFAAFPRLLDDSERVVSFTPFGNGFFAWAYSLLDFDPAGYRAFFINPDGRTWGVATAVPSRRAPVLSTVNGRVVIWGGWVSKSGTSGIFGEPRDDGAVFDPTTNLWSSITCVGAPAAAGSFRNIVPTSTGLLVFSGTIDPPNNALLEL